MNEDTMTSLLLLAGLGVAAFFVLKKDDEPAPEKDPLDTGEGSLLDGKEINGASAPVTVILDADALNLLSDTRLQDLLDSCRRFGGSVSGKSCRLPGALNASGLRMSADSAVDLVRQNFPGILWNASTRTVTITAATIRYLYPHPEYVPPAYLPDAEIQPVVYAHAMPAIDYSDAQRSYAGAPVYIQGSRR